MVFQIQEIFGNILLIRRDIEFLKVREDFNKKNIKSYGIMVIINIIKTYKNYGKKMFFIHRRGWGGGKIWMENSITFNVFFY